MNEWKREKEGEKELKGLDSGDWILIYHWVISEGHLITLFYYHAFQSNSYLWNSFVSKWSSVPCQENSKISVSDWRWNILSRIFLCSPLDSILSLTSKKLPLFVVSFLISHSFLIHLQCSFYPSTQLKLLLTKWPINCENKTDRYTWVLAWSPVVFDIVGHSLLLEAWSSLGFRKSMFSWLCSCLFRCAFSGSLQAAFSLPDLVLTLGSRFFPLFLLPALPPSWGSSFFPVVSDNFSMRTGVIPSVWQSRHSTIGLRERMSDLASVIEF